MFCRNLGGYILRFVRIFLPLCGLLREILLPPVETQFLRREIPAANLVIHHPQQNFLPVLERDNLRAVRNLYLLGDLLSPVSIDENSLFLPNNQRLQNAVFDD
jgi:hypothetical protein